MQRAKVLQDFFNISEGLKIEFGIFIASEENKNNSHNLPYSPTSVFHFHFNLELIDISNLYVWHFCCALKKELEFTGIIKDSNDLFVM